MSLQLVKYHTARALHLTNTLLMSVFTEHFFSSLPSFPVSQSLQLGHIFLFNTEIPAVNADQLTSWVSVACFFYLHDSFISFKPGLHWPIFTYIDTTG